jgi:Ca2+-binding EF-hand superfamily protein
MRNLVKFPQRQFRHIDFSVEQGRSDEEELSDEEQLVNNLRMYPEHVAAARRFFDILDTNHNGYLQEPEFLNAMYRTEPAPPAAPPAVLKDAGKDVFRSFAPEGHMAFPSFCRFLVVMSYDQAADFKWKSEDLEALRTDHLGALQNQSKIQLLKTFVIFDEDSDGKVTKVEFQHTYMSELYWSLRYKQKLASGLLDTDQEYEYCNNRFVRYTAGKEGLGLPEFLRLVDHAVAKRPPYPVGGEDGCIACKLTPEWAKVVKDVAAHCVPTLASIFFVSAQVVRSSIT